MNEFSTSLPILSRRRFVKGLAGTSALLVLGGSKMAWTTPFRHNGPAELRGNRFNLTIGYQPVNFTGNSRTATTVNGSLPAPILRWKEGDNVTLKVNNRLAHDSSIHWHGIILPTNMDGVPGMSFAGIAPDSSYLYHFPIKQSGTYWYHSHSRFQEQTGVYGAIVIDPKEPEPFTYDRDYVVLLSDWSDESPEAIYGKLKKQSHYYNYRERTVGDLWRDIRNKGVVNTWKDRAMWNEMRMSDRDISDVTGATYTFLMNGRTPSEGWMGLFRRGEKVRLRIINAAAMTLFDFRIPGLKMTVVSSDGQNVEPVTVDEIRLGVAETYDVIVEPYDDRAYALFAQAIDRTGYARGVLTPHPEMTVDVPNMDPAPILSHIDMGMAPGQHGSHGHHGDSHQPKQVNGQHQGHMHGNHGGNRHTMKAEQPPKAPSSPSKYGSNAPIIHVPSEYGPGVAMRAADPQYRLDDPGVGLRNNGRNVLTYAQLKNLYPTLDRREPGREIQLHLTGNMKRYMWSVNGINFNDAEPLPLRYGERVRITLVNDTMMNHPIHLHGMWSELETGFPDRIPRKHTVIVQPGAKISYLVTADAKGRWAYHCHLLYHMPGMMREVRVT